MQKILQTTLLLALLVVMLSTSNLFAQNWWGSIQKQFPTQVDNFYLEFDVVPRDSSVARAHITLSNVIPEGWGDNACIIRFVVTDDEDYIDVRNGGTYEADEFYTYYGEFSYHVKMFVETGYEYYSVWARELPDGEEMIVKESAQFRTDQAGVGELQYLNVTIPYADSASGINDPGAELKNIVMTDEAGTIIWEDEGTDYYATETAVASNGSAPAGFGLLPNYPNPFNPSTTIPFQMQENAFVTIAVYNAMGQKITTLVNDFRTTGQHLISWDGTNDLGEKCSSGIYLIKMISNQFTSVHKTLLVQ